MTSDSRSHIQISGKIYDSSGTELQRTLTLNFSSKFNTRKKTKKTVDFMTFTELCVLCRSRQLGELLSKPQTHFMNKEHPPPTQKRNKEKKERKKEEKGL